MLHMLHMLRISMRLCPAERAYFTSLPSLVSRRTLSALTAFETFTSFSKVSKSDICPLSANICQVSLVILCCAALSRPTSAALC